MYEKYAAVTKPEHFAGADDTERMQAAINACPNGGTVQLDPTKSYHFTRLVIEKSITIDANGAKITTKPTWANQGAGAPCFWFKGARGAEASILETQPGASTVATTTPLVGALVKGDWVIIEDGKSVPSWNGLGQTYGGRGEVNRILSVNGNTLTLEKPLEWAYEAATATVSKMTPLTNAAVINVGEIKEIDPGLVYSGSGRGQAPHIVHFQYCINPIVRRVQFKEWNVHCVNFNYCLNPVVEKCYAENPFRPLTGGHGYFTRFDRCTGGAAVDNTSSGVRHHVDWATSYDGRSNGNVAINNRFAAYMTHGCGSKRITSNSDTSLCTAPGDTSSQGWAAGNSEFNSDYDIRIIDFTYVGPNTGIGAGSKTINVSVVNPTIRAGKRGIDCSGGQDGMSIEGGSVEVTTAVGGTSYALRADVSTFNFKAMGLKLKGYARNRIDSSGYINMQDIEIDAPMYLSANAVLISGTPQDLRLARLFMSLAAGVDKAISVTTPPTRQYIIEDNLVSQAAIKYDLPAAPNLRAANNI